MLEGAAVAWHLEAIVHDLRFDVCAIVPSAEEALRSAIMAAMGKGQ